MAAVGVTTPLAKNKLVSLGEAAGRLVVIIMLLLVVVAASFSTAQAVAAGHPGGRGGETAAVQLAVTKRPRQIQHRTKCEQIRADPSCLGHVVLMTSYRQIEEVGMYLNMLSTCKNPLRDATIVLHNNNANIPLEVFEKEFASVPANARTRCGEFIIKSTENFGHDFGAFGALSDCYDELSKFEVVVHTHPDVFPADCDLLWKTTSKAFSKPGVGVVGASYFDHKKAIPPTLCIDFFEYKPALVGSNVFKTVNYKEIDDNNERLQLSGEAKWKAGAYAESVLRRIWGKGVQVVELKRTPVWPKACLLDTMGLRHCHKPKVIDMAAPAVDKRKKNRHQPKGR